MVNEQNIRTGECKLTREEQKNGSIASGSSGSVCQKT